MEKIKRYIKRERSSGFVQTFEYTTYDTIFNERAREGKQFFRMLLDHLRLAFECGLPNKDKSPSGMPELLGIETKQHFNHELSDFISQVEWKGTGNKQHLIVQNHFMNNYSKTIAIEVPVWNDEASGCIDILNVNMNPFIIDVIDFKPDTIHEKKASSQVYRYVEMLIKNTGIPPEYFRGFYCDELNTFEVLINKKNNNAKS